MAETIRGLNIKLGLDGKDLENELGEIKKDLKEQNKDLRAINSNLRYDSSNLDLWKSKQNKLNSILGQTKNKLETQNKELKKAKKAVEIGDISKEEFNKLKRNVTYSEAEVAKLNNQLENTKSKIKKLSNANFEKIGKLGSTLTKSLTLPILGAVSALTAFSIKAAYAADEIGDSAQKIGLSAEHMQEWYHVAQIMGTSTESMNKAFIKVNAILGDIATGNAGRFKNSLDLIGLSFDDLKGKNSNQAFEIIRGALSNVADEAIRVGVANEFFGEKIAAEVLPVLESQVKVINELRDEARKLGIVTQEQTIQAGEFTDALDRTKQSLSSLGVDLASVVLPVLQDLIIKIRDNIIPVLKDWIKKWKALDANTKKIVLTIVGLTAALGPALVIIGKVGPIITIVSMALKAVGTAGIFAGVGIKAATLGIGALIAILAIALLQSEDFRALLKRLTETFMKLLPPILLIIDTLMTALGPILDVIIELVIMLVEILMPILDLILMPLIFQIEMFSQILTALAPLIIILGQVLQMILVPAIKLLANVLEPVLGVVVKIVEFLQKIFDWIGELPAKIIDFGSKIADVFGNITSGIKDISKSITLDVSSNISGAADKVGGLFGNIEHFFGEAFNLGSNTSVANNANTNNTNATTNNITINTTSPTFDIDSINKALGGGVI